jgi:hypothetical protein
MRALVAKGHISNPRYRLKPLPTAPLVVHCRYVVVAPRLLPAAPLVVRRRYLILVPRPLPAVPLVVRRRFFIVTVAAGEEQFGRCAAKQRKYHRLYLSSGEVTLVAM